MKRQIKNPLHLRNRKLPAQRAIALVSVIILLFGTASAVFFANMFARQSADEFRNGLLQKNASLQATLTDSAGRYTQLLRAGAAMFSLKYDVSQADWHHFYIGMQVEKYLPDTLGIGYAQYLRPGQVQAFVDAQRAQGRTDFKVSPDYVRSEYTAVMYLEPTNSTNINGYGYDMMSEPVRNAAMSMARDSNDIRATGPVVLRQDADTGDGRTGGLGIIMYQPVYEINAKLDTIEERRNALRGFVYVTVRPSDIVQSYFAVAPQIATNTSITITDVTDGVNAQVAKFGGTSGDQSSIQSVLQKVPIADREWAVTIEGRPGLLGTVIVPIAIISIGVALSFALAAGMLRTLLKRLERVEHTYAAEVERTKDELLALASHQLRTPASGVKQYIGILTSGIAGQLTEAQQQIAEKAYATNERQIEIINQLLYVSKIEAGKIIIKPERSDMTRIVQRIINLHAPSAAEKDIKLTFRTKRPQYVYGDEQYYPMIIDNLISNAIKYSYRRTSVTVSLSRRGDMLAVAVTDKGVGVAAEDKSQLFKKFNRIQNPLSRSEAGSGLGLFLAYQLARAHGGDIEVRTAPEKGSTFTLLLPTKRVVKEALVSIVN